MLCHLQYSIIYHTFAVARVFRGLVFYATFNIFSVIYHICAVVSAFRSLMFYATFNIQSFTTLML